MTPAARLLTAVSLTTAFKRNIHIALSNRDIKVHHMTTISLNHLLIKNLRKQASAPEALLSTYIDLQDSNVSKKTRKEFRKRIMEPYLNTCYEVHNHQNCGAKMVVRSIQPGTPFIPSNSNHNSNVDGNVVAKIDKSNAKQNYKAMRKWKTVGRGLRGVNLEENCTVRLFSYNILAQHLIEMHRYLYKHHNQPTLDWDVRRESLIQEILEAEATVICLQEMQQQHLKDFVKPFEDNGYKYLYKKRTNDKEDGLLMMYRSDTFNLLEYTNVEFFQTGIELLSRDNVAIIAKFALKDSPQTKLVVATTHLLYNPKRNDVRLGQTQILLAELERIAFIKNTSRGPRYHPMIIAGDFNLKPFSGVYDFITQGSFQYVGKSRTLGPPDHRRLSNSLIPPHLHVTDGCQHYHVLVKRLSNRGEGQVMLENSERSSSDKVSEKSTRDQFKKVEVDVETQKYQQIQVGEGLQVTFGSGCLTHPFNLRSVYSHIDRNGQNEATTHQDEWITVDYVFYSDVKLVEKYALPTKKQCEALARIPNLAVGSDHLSIGATFVIKKKKGS